MYSAPISIPGPPFCGTTHLNNACATGDASNGDTVEACDPAEVCFTCDPDISIVKTAGDDLRGPIENPGHLVESSDGNETSFALDRTIVIIGSDAAADIRIGNGDVASYHIEIVFFEGNYRIRHIDGKSPVTLNGAKINKATLKDGDSIALSDRAFTFRAPSS